MAALPNHSLGEDKMQLAVDQLTRCIKVTAWVAVSATTWSTISRRLSSRQVPKKSGHHAGTASRERLAIIPSACLEPEAFNVEREMVHQADAAPGRRKKLPPKIVGCKTLDGLKNVLALPVRAPRSTRCSADGSDGMTDAPSDLALDLLDHTSGLLGDRAPSDKA
jgi:hypothetical protein